MALNVRQQRFVAGVLAGKSAKQAYIDAGYKVTTDHSAESAAERLLRNVEVARLIEQARRKALTAADLTAERTIRELARLVCFDPRTLFRDDGTLKDPGEWDDDTAAAVASLEIEEVKGPAGSDDEQEAQPHGGSLKRSRGKVTVGKLKKVKLWDKKGAIDTAMKHLGLLRDQLQVTGADGKEIVVKVLSGARMEDL